MNAIPARLTNMRISLIHSAHRELPTIARGTESGISEGHPVPLASLARGHHRERVHAGAAGECAADGRRDLRDAYLGSNGAEGDVVGAAGVIWHQIHFASVAKLLI